MTFPKSNPSSLSPLDALNTPASQSHQRRRGGPASSHAAPFSDHLFLSNSSQPPKDSPSAGAPQEQDSIRASGPREEAKSREYSDQDILTRKARASLPPIKQNPSIPHPLNNSISRAQQLYFSSIPSSLSKGPTPNMEALRQHYARPGSVGSSSTRSSFESRPRSPLSNSSSYESGSRTSQDTSYSNDDLSSERTPISALMEAKKDHTDHTVSVPAFARYGAGGQSRQQKLMIPPRMSRGPVSPVNPSSGRSYIPRAPGEKFMELPEEILLVVLEELKKLHLDVGSLSCSTCWMRDLVSISVTCKKFWRAARVTLYEDIQLIGNDSILHTKKKFKGSKYGTRLKLLRRTLRTRPDYAEYVKVLKVPHIPGPAKTQKEQDEYLDLVASVIMACPNLERVPGFHPVYNHEFSRFVHAMSTRQDLLERVWIISDNPSDRQRRFRNSDDSDSLTPVWATPMSLTPEQRTDFLICHSAWSQLRTLVLHCNPGGMIDSPLFGDTWKHLPSLQNLHVSCFPAPSFNDTTLLSLPPLRSLRLEHLPGVTHHGLSNFSSSSRTKNLIKLSLISLPVLSLPVLARLFSHLTSLTHFTISQAPSLSLPTGVDIFLYPYMASSSLQYLTWELTNPDDDRATEILAKSILHLGFPSLKQIRAPTDFDGSLQALCKPRERIELPGDRYRNIGSVGSQYGGALSYSLSISSSSTQSAFSSAHSYGHSVSTNTTMSPTHSAFSSHFDKYSRHSEDNRQEKGMSLAVARRMAQQRIDAAASKPRFHIIVWDEEGEFLERFALGGFIGDLSSKIHYSLKPDVDSMDETVCGIEGVVGLVDESEEVNPRDGCTGSWNIEAGERGKAKGKDRWWHTERARWMEIPLGRLF